MLVRDLQVDERNGWAVLSAEVVHERAGTRNRIEYRFRGVAPDEVSRRGDAFLTFLLIPAMFAGEDLVLEAPVSSKLLSNTQGIVDLIHSWDPRYARVRVDAAPAAVGEGRGAGVALFFSGGVDSFYSLLKNLDEHPEGPDAITRLVHVHRYGTRHGYDEATRDKITSHMEGIARASGKELLLVDGNLREQWRAPWRMHHGPALISTMLPLGSIIGRCLVASSWAPQTEHPWGTHPELDPKWSTEDIQIINDASGIYRTEKLASRVAHSHLALENLRVCWRDDAQPKNCGRCRKCVQAMVVLHTEGVLDRCTAFESPLQARWVWGMNLEGRRFSGVRHAELLGSSMQDRWMRAGFRFAILRQDVSTAMGRLRQRRRERSVP